MEAMETESRQGGGLAWRVAGALLLWFAADAAAVQLWTSGLPFIRYTYGWAMMLFELYSFTHVLAFVAMGFLLRPWFLARRQGLYPLAVFLVIGCFYLTVFEKFGRRSYDYSAWFNGMMSQVNYGDPYAANPQVSPIYWYTPALAQLMAGWRWVVGRLFPHLRMVEGSVRQTTDHLVFYLFQCTQFTLLMGLYWLTYAWGRWLKMDRKGAALAAGFLLVFNTPLFRMLAFHQANLWLVNSILVILLFRDRSPCLAGLAMAVGFHMKLYPAILGLPLLLTWRWKPILWAGVFTLAILAVQCAVSGWDVWLKFLTYMANPPIGSMFRDNSLHGIAKNLLKPFDAAQYTGVLWAILQAISVGWIAWRMARRERLVRRLRAEPGADAAWLNEFHFQEQAMDTLVMSFFLSPMVFEHHYVMAISVILWTWVVWGARAPRAVVIGALLILAVPVYDVGPLSWNRIAGLLVLALARPVGYAPPPDGTLAFLRDPPAGGARKG